MLSIALFADSPTLLVRLVLRVLSRAGLAGTGAAAVALLVAGCDRQNADAPQAASQDQAAKPAAPMPPHRIETTGAGQMLPTLDVRAPGGETAKLSSLVGKPTILNLWATWCAPCIAELPTLNALAAQVGDRANVVALSQDIDDDSSHVARYLTDNGWTRLAAWHDPDNLIGIRYGGALPTTILFDASGREVVRVVGPIDWSGEEAQRLIDRLHIPPAP